MNTLEDRVRAATRAAADTVPPDGVPPLRLPEFGKRHGTASRWNGAGFRPYWSRLLAPAAAAVAVIAVVITIAIVGRTTHSGLSGVASGPPTGKLTAGMVPDLYVALAHNGNPNFVPSYAVVRATKTGATLATITAPKPNGTFVAVTAAADDRTFVLDAQPWVPPRAVGGPDQTFEPRTFYLLRVDPSASQPARLTRLSLPGEPQGSVVTGLALSPDGSKLAIAVEPDNVKNDPNLQEIQLYTLATGAVRTWSSNGTVGSGPDEAKSLSWTADGRTLAIDWYGDGPQGGVRLLNVDATGTNLLTDSRLAVSSRTMSAGQTQGSPTCQQDEVITPDGSTIVCGAVAVIGQSTVSPLSRDAEAEYIEYSTGAGKAFRVLAHSRINNAGALAVDVLWTNASGSVVIGVIPTTDAGRVGVISGNTFTPLPWNSKLDLSGAW